MRCKLWLGLRAIRCKLWLGLLAIRCKLWLGLRQLRSSTEGMQWYGQVNLFGAKRVEATPKQKLMHEASVEFAEARL